MSRTPAIRFKGFTDPWEQRKLNRFIFVTNDKNVDGMFAREDVLSVSREEGVVNQIEFQGRSFAGADVSVYGILRHGDIVYTKSPLRANPYGIIKTNKGCSGIVSTLYATYRARSGVDPNFVQCYFDQDARLNNYLHPLVNKGAKNDMKVSAENAITGEVTFPGYDEQRRIASLLASLDNLITLHQRKYDKLVTLKKALLDKMFPRDGACVPELRFAGFTDPWEQRKLGELSEIVGGGTPDTNNPDYWDGDIDWYSPAELGEQVYADTSQRRITREGYENSSAKMLPAGRTILFTSRAGIGTTAILRRSACTNQGFQSLVLRDEVNIYFVYSMSARIKAYAESKASGSTFLEISGKQLAEMELMLPNRAEQDAIGDFFTSLDNLITLHQRKFDQLAVLKKALLDKMFPRDGSAVPEVRFAGFTDPWEQRKLGELGTTYGGLTGKTKDDFGHGDARFVPYTNVFDNPVADPSRLGLVEIDPGQNQVRYGDALFTVSSETPEEVGMSSVWLSDLDNLYLNSFCFGYRQDGSFDPYYLAYMLRSKSVRGDIELLAQGISRFNISKGKVMEVVVPVPAMSEQRQIGALFTSLDNLITLHQRKLELLKNLKAALLDKMFV